MSWRRGGRWRRFCGRSRAASSVTRASCPWGRGRACGRCSSAWVRCQGFGLACYRRRGISGKMPQLLFGESRAFGVSTRCHVSIWQWAFSRSVRFAFVTRGFGRGGAKQELHEKSGPQGGPWEPGGWRSCCGRSGVARDWPTCAREQVGAFSPAPARFYSWGLLEC